MPLVVKQAELLVTEGAGIGGKTFSVGVQGVIDFVQQAPDRVRTNPQPQAGQFLAQIA
jgi:hypothetical protein